MTEIYDNKIENGFKAKLEQPWEDQMFYSEHTITNDVLIDIILEALKHCNNFDFGAFDQDFMQVKIDEKKTLTFRIEEDVIKPEEYQKVIKRKLKNGIQTQILMDIQRSVPGTELCIEIIKRLQKRYPRSVFIDDSKILISGKDIQSIRMDKKFMYDPGTRKYLEMTRDEMKKIREEAEERET